MRILLSRTDRVGDLILSTPAIASVRRSFPAAHVTCVCSRYNSVVLEGNRDIDDLLVLPEDEPPQRFGERFEGECDLAIALAPRDVDHRIVGATRAPRRIGYTYVRRYAARLLGRRYLTDLLVSEADPLLSERHPRRVVRHEVDQVLALAEAAGATTLERELIVPVTNEHRAEAARMPTDAVVVQLAQRWLDEGSTATSLFMLLSELRALERPIVATFGSDAVELGEAVRTSGLADAVLGELPFLVWAAALERAACVLTVDTGATHVASAMRRPTVVLFEHRFFALNSQEWSPYRVPFRAIRKPADERSESLRESRAEIVEAVRSLL